MMNKVALVHYWLNNLRGGENVLAELCGMFPRADIFTHAWNPELAGEPFCRHKISETFISRLPGARRGCQKYLPLMPAALKKLDLGGYDLIISSESGPAKGIRKPAGACHICYCHTPMRYLWDMYEEYYAHASPAAKLAMRLFKNPLRKYDLKSAESVDTFIANSRFVAGRIERIYHRDAVVVHPPVDTEFFGAAAASGERDYYLFVGQLISYKRPDIVVEFARRTRRRVVIAGDGQLAAELRRGAPENAVFAGRVSREELRRLYANAKALIFPGVEDFGIVPLEAQAAGTPVIALGAGGALETVVAGRTGIFFDTPDAEALCCAVEQFEAMRFDPEAARRQAAKFSRAEFRSGIAGVLKEHGFGAAVESGE